jgi:enoyl-CoA hydratase/carnithine racemase
VPPSSRDTLIRTVVIDRPEKRNALSPELIVRLREDIAAASADEGLRAVILCGSGTVFSAGVDVQALAALTTPEKARALITSLHLLCAAVRECPVPVIAAIEGACVGGALELAAACDIRVAGESAFFAMPEVKLGLPSVIEAALLPRVMAPGPAAAMLYTGARITAAQAYQWGLVSELVPAGQAGAAARRMAGEIAECGPRAVRTQKQLLRHWETATPDDAIRHSINVFADAFAGREPLEGTSAWKEKRAPSWNPKK